MIDYIINNPANRIRIKPGPKIAEGMYVKAIASQRRAFGDAKQINNFIDAANWIGSYRDYASIHIVALITDVKSAPIGLIEHTQGSHQECVAHPDSLAELISTIPNTSQVWLGYNYPDHMLDISENDRSLLSSFTDYLAGTDTKCQGLIVMGLTGIGIYYKGAQITAFNTQSVNRSIHIPIYEGRLFRIPND